MGHGTRRWVGVALAVLGASVVATDVDPGVEPLGARATSCDCRVVWVALEDAHQLTKVDLDRRRVVIRKDTPGGPHNITISPNGKTVVAALWDAQRITMIRDGRVRNIVLGGAPHDVKIARGRVVITNQNSAHLDLVSVRGRGHSEVGLKADPHDVALTPDGRRAWVSLEGSDDMAVVNLEKRSVRYVSTGKAPHDLLFSPDGTLWVTDWNGAIHVFSQKGNRLKTIPLGVEAHHLDFTPDGRQIWITDHAAHRVFVVRTRDYVVRKRFKVPGAPHHVTVTSDGDRAVVADHDRGSLIVYNVHKLRRAFTLEVGAGPHGVWAMP